MKDLKFEVVEKISALRMKARDLKRISKFESISPPSVFIGSKLKYPLVNVGILSPIEKVDDASIFDDAKTWAKDNYSIPQVIGLRENLLNSRFQSQVTDVRLNKKFVEIAKDIAIASSPVDVEIELKNQVNIGKRIDRVLTPHGMKANLKNAKVTSNVKIDKKVDRVMNDEIKANEGLNYLFQSGINEYSLAKILSVGVMGMKKDKRMVPTRWSITATDDTLTKNLLKNIRENKWIEDYEFFFGEFMGNQYLILLLPGVWSYELFELYYPGSSWNPGKEMKASTDSEGYGGRTSYASNCVGGYYAARLPIVEYLNSIGRQASVLTIRLETPSYWAALGVWVVRESVRKALSREVMKFSDKKEFLDSVKKVGKIKYDFDCDLIFEKSKLLKIYGIQRSLRDWF
jgi:DNA repair protein NreA